MTALPAANQIGKDDRQHGGLLMAQAMHAAALGHVPAQHFPEAAQLVLGHLAAGRHLSFIGLEPLGQLPGAQMARSVFD